MYADIGLAQEPPGGDCGSRSIHCNSLSRLYGDE